MARLFREVTGAPPRAPARMRQTVSSTRGAVLALCLALLACSATYGSGEPTVAVRLGTHAPWLLYASESWMLNGRSLPAGSYEIVATAGSVRLMRRADGGDQMACG